MTYSCKDRKKGLQSIQFHIVTIFFPDLIDAIRMEKFIASERDEVLSFLERASVRLDAWFQWFNTSQKGNNMVIL